MTSERMSDGELITAAIAYYRREAGKAAIHVAREHSAVRHDGGETRVRIADRDDVTIAIYHWRGDALVPRGL